MPRFLAVGHVTWDRLRGQQVLGGTASYAALAARRLGWEAAVLTCAGADFEPERDLPGVAVFLKRATTTTRFENVYDDAGVRRQVLSSRSEAIDLTPLPDEWRNPDVLLLGPVAGEIAAGTATGFDGRVVGAIAQGWLREVDEDGAIGPRAWREPGRDLAGVHVVFLSEHDAPSPAALAREILTFTPIVAVTRGWEGLQLYTRNGVHVVPTLPRQEVDPTGAGDVLAAAFLVRYHEGADPLEAAAFGACAASCAVEGVGASSLGDRVEVLRRMGLRDRLIEEGDWDE